MNDHDLTFLEREPTVLLYNSFVTNNSVLSEPMDNIFHIYSFGFVLGEDFSKTAKSFRNHTTNAFKRDLVWLFWLMILSVEDLQNGAFYIDVSKRANLSLYNAVIKAIARKKCNLHTGRDTKLIKQYVKGHYRFDLEQQMDLANEIARLEAEDIKKQRAEQEKKNKQKKRKRNATPEPGEREIIGYMMNMRENKRVSDPIPGHPEINGTRLNPYADIAMTTTFDIVDAEGNLYEKPVLQDLIRKHRDTIIPKVKMFVTPVPHKDDKDELVGYLVQFITLDSSWNPGKTLNKLKNADLIREMYPHYAYCPTKKFPTSNFTSNRYIQKITLMQRVLMNDREVDTRFGNQDLEDYSSPLHLSKTLTIDFAVGRLMEHGGDPTILDGLMRNSSRPENLNPGMPMTLNPTQGCQTYMYMPEQVFWYNPEYCGLYEQYFPGVPVVDTSVLDPVNEPPSPLIALGEKFLVSREDVYAAIPELLTKERTGNDLVLLHRDAEIILKKLEKARPKNRFETFTKMHSLYLEYGEDWRDYVEDEDYEELERYEAYRLKYREIQQIFMDQFKDKCVLDGQVENLQVPAAFKALLLWYKNYADKHESFTREHVLEDPDLGFFGNVMVRTFMTLGYTFNLVQPLFTALLEGQFSVYDNHKDTVRFNLLVFGGPGTGKSYHIMEMAQKLMIEGTWGRADYITAAADSSDIPIEMMIRLRDEIESWYVNSKDAQNNPRKVDQKKTALSSGTVTTRTFERIEMPNGKWLRGVRKVVSKQDYTEAGSTNHVKPPNCPLSDRYVMLTMKQSDINPSKYKDTDENSSQELKSASVEYFHRNQFMSAIIKKAVYTFAISEKVEMQLWDDVWGKMLDILKKYGLDIRVARGSNILKTLARQYTARMAGHHTWDFPGSPYFNQPFALDQLTELQRYLYITPDIILFVFTMLSEKFIDSDYGNVMRAVFKLLHIKEADYHTSPYILFRRDTERMISFKRIKTDSTRDHRTEVDLNYFQFDSSPEELAQKLSPLTNPRLPPKHVAGVLTRLSETTCVPRTGQNKRNGYGLVPDKVLADHVIRKNRRMIVGAKDIPIRVQQLCSEVESSHVESVMRRVNGLHANFLETTNDMLTARQHKCHISQLDLVLLDLLCPFDETFEIETIGQRAAALKEGELQSLPENDLKAILMSIDGYTFDDQLPPHEQFGNYSLSFADAVILSYGFKIGYFREYRGPNQPVRTEYSRFSEDDIPMLNNVPVTELADGEYQSIPVVQILKAPHRVCICPMAYEMFNPVIIQDAWEEATILPTTRPGKRLLGWPLEEDSQLLKSLSLTSDYIGEVISAFNEMAEENNLLPRSHGIAFDRLTNADRDIERFVSEPSRRVGKNQTEPYHVSRDLGRESAIRQHIRAGFPIDEEVHDPAFLMRRYRKNGGQFGHVDYPKALLEKKRVYQKRRATTRLGVGSRAVLRSAKENENKRRKKSSTAAQQGDALDNYFASY